jgi:hypothetical protein
MSKVKEQPVEKKTTPVPPEEEKQIEEKKPERKEKKSEEKKPERKEKKKKPEEEEKKKRKREILIISSLTKEVTSLLRSIFMMKKDVLTIEEPYVFDYDSTDYLINTVTEVDKKINNRLMEMTVSQKDKIY